MIRKLLYRFLSDRSKKSVDFDILRFKARHFGNRSKDNGLTKLHLGCWNRKVDGWLNVDVVGSEHDIDFSIGVMPFASDRFEAIASQHVIEHLEMERELLPLLRECRRILKPDGEIWLSCPDLEKICNAYLQDKGQGLVHDKTTRIPEFSMGNTPSQHVINLLFHQGGEHKNLFDLELIGWLLKRAGFRSVEKVDEDRFLNRFPEFPKRGDDYQSLYVKAVAA